MQRLYGCNLVILLPIGVFMMSILISLKKVQYEEYKILYGINLDKPSVKFNDLWETHFSLEILNLSILLVLLFFGSWEFNDSPMYLFLLIFLLKILIVTIILQIIYFYISEIELDILLRCQKFFIFLSIVYYSIFIFF